MFADGAFVALLVVPDSDSFEFSILENAIFNSLFGVVSADAFQIGMEVFPDTDNLVGSQEETVLATSVVAFLVAVEFAFFVLGDDWFESGYLFSFWYFGGCFFHETDQEFFESVHVFGEVFT